jgi:hypothetical protein
MYVRKYFYLLTVNLTILPALQTIQHQMVGLVNNELEKCGMSSHGLILGIIPAFKWKE